MDTEYARVRSVQSGPRIEQKKPKRFVKELKFAKRATGREIPPKHQVTVAIVIEDLTTSQSPFRSAPGSCPPGLRVSS